MLFSTAPANLRDVDENRQRIHIVLGLRHQICRNEIRIPRIAHDHRLGRPGEKINCAVE